MKDSLSPINNDSSIPPQTHFRVRVLSICAVIIFVVLTMRVWSLQIIQHDHYAQLAEQVRFREVPLLAERGIIYDRNGEILVRNVPRFTVSVVPADLPENEEEQKRIVSRLVELLDLQDNSWIVHPLRTFGDADIAAYDEAHALARSLRQRAYQSEPVSYILEQVQEAALYAPYRPLVLKKGVERDLAFIIEEESLSLPGVRVDVEPQREYLTADLTAHLLGYMGPIPKERKDDYAEKGYASNDPIGLAGLEYQYESVLRGVQGKKVIEEDVAGREVRTVGEIIPPELGKNLHLSLDVNLQKATREALEKGLRESQAEIGAAIAMNPTTGEILSMVSLPAYDNNLFAAGISPDQYERLSRDERHPLVNHALMGQFPPGSTFKLVVASGGLEEGVITPNTPLHCGGIMYVPNKYFPDDPQQAQPFYCWIHNYGRGHGNLTLTQGLAQSCDIYFYQVAGGFRDFQGLGLDRLAHYALAFGYGDFTGIDLPGEAKGLIPNAQWKRLNYGESWVTGDTYNMAIGQGFVLATPLQVLDATAAVANGGHLYQPSVVREITDAEGNVVEPFAPTLIRELPVTPAHIEEVQKGMLAAVEGGTARRGALQGIRVAGKTGTAEYPGERDKDGNLPTHAWFTAYAPFEAPEIAVVVFIYNGGEGSEIAAPVAADIMSAYFGVPKAYED